MGKGFQTSLEMFNKMYDNMPYFTDVFDEDSFYVFVVVFVLSTVMVAFLCSRFITIKEWD